MTLYVVHFGGDSGYFKWRCLRDIEMPSFQVSWTIHCTHYISLCTFVVAFMKQKGNIFDLTLEFSLLGDCGGVWWWYTMTGRWQCVAKRVNLPRCQLIWRTETNFVEATLNYSPRNERKMTPCHSVTVDNQIMEKNAKKNCAYEIEAETKHSIVHVICLSPQWSSDISPFDIKTTNWYYVFRAHVLLVKTECTSSLCAS